MFDGAFFFILAPLDTPSGFSDIDLEKARQSRKSWVYHSYDPVAKEVVDDGSSSSERMILKGGDRSSVARPADTWPGGFIPYYVSDSSRFSCRPAVTVVTVTMKIGSVIARYNVPSRAPVGTS